MITVSELTIYPVKSMAGISLQSSYIDAMGLQYDRRWMLVSPDGKFMTQRSHPQMALIQPRIENNQLILSSFGLDDHYVPAADESSPDIKVQVWDDIVDAKHLSTETDEWIEQTVGEACRLVYMPDNVFRQCDTTYAKQGDRTGFSDGFPLLLISEASLADLNDKLEKPVPMKRFRPNLVVKGCEAFAEDGWKKFAINEISFRVVKPCSRCVITTVDPAIGMVTSPEPLQTLASYRKQGDKVMFGQNVVQDATGNIKLGDVVEVLNA